MKIVPNKSCLKEEEKIRALIAKADEKIND